MNSNIKIFLLCPVPDEQKPINEYIGLKENLLTSWTTLSNKNYEKKIYFLFSILFGIISIGNIFAFQGIYYWFDWFLENLFFTTISLLFLFLIILSRWMQIENRFETSRLFYEEASWYDGQIWEKPLSLIKNDTLIRTQKIIPIITRIQRTIFQFFCLSIISFLFLEIEMFF